MPLLVSFRFQIVKAVLAEHGIYVLQEFPDGQVCWGNEPLNNPYTGLFHFADYFTPDRYDIFTVRGILSKMDKAGEQKAVEEKLFASLQDEEYDEDGGNEESKG
jgi:hypothetical protein